MTRTPEERMKRFQELGRWAEAARISRAEIAKKPDKAHWWYIHLGLQLIKLKRFKQARRALDKADEGPGFCPLIRWYEAELEYDQGHYAAALEVLDRLHLRCNRWLATSKTIGPCWESELKARTLANDCRARIGWCCLHLGRSRRAVVWWRRHLTHRRRGQFSVYDAKDIRSAIRETARSKP